MVVIISGGPLKLGKKFRYLRSSLIYWKWCYYTPSESIDFYRYAVDYIEVCSIRWNKIGFLPSSCWVSSTQWIHNMDDNKTHRKNINEITQNDTSYLENILEITSHDAAIRKLMSHITNHVRKTKKICGTLLERGKRTHKESFSIDLYT